MSQLDDSTKQALRFTAVGALLHNLGKIHSKFLDKYVNKSSNNYLFQHILGLIIDHADRSKVPENWQAKYDVVSESKILTNRTSAALKNALNIPTPFNDRDYTIGDLIEYLGVGAGEPWYDVVEGIYGIKHIFPDGSRLTHLMNRAHGGASGGEKAHIATAQQPDAAYMYLSTPFGYETAAPNINDINDLLKEIENVIHEYLGLPAVPFPLAEFAGKLMPLIGQAIADTQRPLNDVTVGDIGHTGMAFLLNQAVEWIFTKRRIDHTELAKQGEHNTIFWRLLTIHTDGLRYLEDASSMADLRVRQRQLHETFQKISQQLEETLLAVEIYADEQRCLFVFPNLEQDSSAYQTIENIVNHSGIDGLRLTSHLSDPVTNHPDDKNATYIGDQVLKQLKELPPYDFDANTIAAYWPKEAPNKQRCSACNLRPQGYGADQVAAYNYNPDYYRNKAEGRNICCICMARLSGVAEKWAIEELNKSVWLDEIADNNGRLALIVGRWGLEYFLENHFYPHENCSKSREMWLHNVTFLNSPPPNGHMFSINQKDYIWQASQSILSGEKEIANPFRKNKLSIQAPSSMQVTIQDVVVAGNQLALTVQEDLTSTFLVDSQVKCEHQDFLVKGAHSLETVNDAGKQKILRNVLWDTTYPFIIQEKPKKINVLNITSHGYGEKNKSFSRLRRIWQTTRAFWETFLEETNQGDKAIITPIPYRLQIKGNLLPNDKKDEQPGLFHAYDLRLTKSVKLSVVWDPDNKRFITCDNLEYLSKPEQLGKPVIEFLKFLNGELTIESPSGYGRQNKEWGSITILYVGEIENSSYSPVIPILAEPRTFMALLPAECTLDVIHSLKTKYEREMGKVRNRLPLHLGAIYFHRRTPLRAAVDAGRRMLKYDLGCAKDQLWTVESIEQKLSLPSGLATGTQQFDQTIAVTIKNDDDRCLTWYVPAKMGDGQTPDKWYPYIFIQNDVSDRQHTFKALPPKSDGSNEKCWLVHAEELRAGDRVYFTSATFDFQWLDSAGERFEIAYNNGKRPNHLIRPFLLDELTTIRKAWDTIAGNNGLTANQIYALRDLIEIKRENWKPSADNWEQDCQQQTGMFWLFCRDAINNANWKSKPEKESVFQLTDWAVSGLLADVIQLYMGVMKQKPQREENNEQSE
jgi:CRISPR-associated Csx11 family protein